MKSSVFTYSVIVFFLICSCRKDVPVPNEKETKTETIISPADTTKQNQATMGQAAFDFEAMAGNKPLAFDTVWYLSSGTEYFTVTKFNYYLSNIRLKRSDGTYHSENESYHLIRHAQGKDNFIIKSIPTGTYVSVELMIGVDSLRNVSGAQTGDLDVVNDMFWDWNTGYIFYKLEGVYTDGSTPDPQYAIHIGGFEGPFSCLQKITIDLPTQLVISSQNTSTIQCHTIVEEVFDSPRKISLAQYYNELSTGPKIFQDLSVNYRDMIKVKQVIN